MILLVEHNEFAVFAAIESAAFGWMFLPVQAEMFDLRLFEIVESVAGTFGRRVIHTAACDVPGGPEHSITIRCRCKLIKTQSRASAGTGRIAGRGTAVYRAFCFPEKQVHVRSIVEVSGQ